jgi:hypothetical protein
MMLQQPLSLTEWVANSGASNHTTPDLCNISLFRPPNPSIPSSIIVGNGSVLPITSVGDTIHPAPFYLKNDIITPDNIKNLISVHQFTTDNWCSMEFDHFGLSMKDVATRNLITRCNSSGPLYTIRLAVMCAPGAFTHYALTAATAPTSI